MACETSRDSGGSDEDPPIPSPPRRRRARAHRRSVPTPLILDVALAPLRFSPHPCTTSPPDLASVQAWPPLLANAAAGPLPALTSSTYGIPSSFPAPTLPPSLLHLHPASQANSVSLRPSPSTSGTSPPPAASVHLSPLSLPPPLLAQSSSNRWQLLVPQSQQFLPLTQATLCP